MNIRVTLDIPAERLPDLAKWLEELSSEERSNTCAVPVPEAPAVVVEPGQPAAVQASSEPAAVKITKTMIRARGLELTKAGKTDELGEVFKKFGADKLSSLKEADYEEAYSLMGELL